MNINDLMRDYTANNNPPEFAAKKLSVATEKSILGLQRWGKDFMVSFFPVNFEGERLKYDSGIDKVYDLFLTSEQVEIIVKAYNDKTTSFRNNMLQQSYINHPYHKLLEEAGHILRRDEDGEIDIFALSEGFHNGPTCIKCGDSWCQHCNREVKQCIES